MQVNPAAQSAYRTLEGWAVGTLLETHAIRECPEHGHIRDYSDPEAWENARAIAREQPFPGATPAAAIAALDEVMQSIGDVCPGC